MAVMNKVVKPDSCRP